MKKQPTHGGARKGAGRPEGSSRKEPTVVMRVPISLAPKFRKMIEAANKP